MTHLSTKNELHKTWMVQLVAFAQPEKDPSSTYEPCFAAHTFVVAANVPQVCFEDIVHVPATLVHSPVLHDNSCARVLPSVSTASEPHSTHLHTRQHAWTCPLPWYRMRQHELTSCRGLPLAQMRRARPVRRPHTCSEKERDEHRLAWVSLGEMLDDGWCTDE